MHASALSLDNVMKRGLITSVALLCMIACGPSKVGVIDSESTGDADATGSSTDGGTESTSTTETSDDSGLVPTKQDMPIVHCDPFMQDCPEGEKCVPYAGWGGSFDSSKCVPILGDQGTGEPCSYAGYQASTDDCDANNFCWDVMEIDGELIGFCSPFCLGSADVPECPPGSSCSISGNSTLSLCISQCDPLVQDCNDGYACYWANGNFSCVFTTEDIPVGEPCGFINDCEEGFACLIAEVLPDCNGSACCSGFCNLQLGDAPCEALLPGTVCSSFFEEGMAPPGFGDVGVCILPQP
jgi:hypothetical protein